EEYYRAWYLKETILFLNRFYDICCIFIGNADQQYHYGSSCIQQIWRRDNSLSWLLCSFYNSTHSFCDGTHQLCNYNDDSHQKCNYRSYFRTCYSEYPTNFGNDFWIFDNSY